ncbi:MAG: hypothetical protein K2Y14_01120 [Burkholderiales bacterium]|nr:hypothetical protein [Burkholderiales bacterium]
MINKSYQLFLSELKSLISQDASLESFGQLVMSSQYCRYLSKKVARNYHVDYEDLHAEMVLAVIEGNLLQQIISGEYNFNGRYFELRVSDIAKKLYAKNFTPPVDDIECQIINIDDIVLSRVDERLQQTTFNELKLNKINELCEYQNKLINSQQFSLNEFCAITELTIEQLALKTGVSRNKLQRNRCKENLIPVFEQYLILFKYWFDKRESWINSVMAKFASKHDFFVMISPSYSYSKFIKVCESPSIWDLEYFRLTLEILDV